MNFEFMFDPIVWGHILLLVFVQNTSFSIVSRSRNRDNIWYHVIAASFSNTIWFFTFVSLLTYDMETNWLLAIPYGIGSVLGSVFGVKVSKAVERFLGVASDTHLKQQLNPGLKSELKEWIEGEYNIVTIEDIGQFRYDNKIILLNDNL